MVWKEKPEPRFEVVSLRVTEEELERIDEATEGGTRQAFLHAAVLFALELRNAPATITRRKI
jgi:hypothetical protein